jgi:hypothetical protein
VGRDAPLGRPNAANDLGVHGSRHLLEQLLGAALDAVPPCSRKSELDTWVRETASKLLQAGRRAPCAQEAPSH